MRFFGSIAKVLAGKFEDTFDRPNTTSGLGVSSSGKLWDAVSGLINVQNNKAVSTPPTNPAVGSDYSISTIEAQSEDSIITLSDTNSGSSLALWVQTSSDWWMVSVDSTFNTIPGAVNYTSGTPLVYSSSGPSFTSSNEFTSANGTFTASSPSFTQGANLFTAGPNNFTAGANQFTSSPASFTQGAFSSTSANQWTTVQGFATQTFWAQGPGFVGSQQAFTPGIEPNYTSGPVFWAATTPNYTRQQTWTSNTNFTRSQNFTIATAPTTFTGSPATWSSARHTARSGPNTFVAFTGFTSSRSFTSGGGGSSWTAGPATFSNQVPFTFTSAFANTWSSSPAFTTGRNFTSGTPTPLNAGFSPTFTPGTFWSANQNVSAGFSTTPAPTTFTTAGGTFSSSQAFTSSTPFSSATPFSSSTPFTSSQTFTSSQVFTAGNAFTSALAYTSNNTFTSAKDPDTFAFASYVRIRKSVNNVVSTVSSSLVSTASTIKSILVQTLGNQITVKPYSDENLVTQIGNDLVYTATGAVINAKYGISISAAEYDQSAIIGTEIVIDKNDA